MEAITEDSKKAPFKFNHYHWLAGGIPVAYIASQTSIFVLVAYVFVGVAVLNPGLIREAMKPKESTLTDADREAMQKATDFTDALITGQKLKLSDAERAGLIVDHFYRLKDKEAPDE